MRRMVLWRQSLGLVQRQSPSRMCCMSGRRKIPDNRNYRGFLIYKALSNSSFTEAVSRELEWYQSRR